MIDYDNAEHLLSVIPQAKMQQALRHAMTSLTAFQRMLGFLTSSCRMNWLRQTDFQVALATLFIQLINRRNLLPTECRLFTQFMDKAAFNWLSPEGDSVVSCLCTFKEGVSLIKDEKWYESLARDTLAHEVSRFKKSLRALLEESCEIQLPFAGAVAGATAYRPAMF